jgi:hypothetical protein
VRRFGDQIIIAAPLALFFFGGLFVFIPISYESPTGAAPLSLSDPWVADVKPLSPCPLSQLLRVTLLRIKYLLT